MGSNSFGNIFKITTWGESHGKAIGVIIDGCPANLEIDSKEIDEALTWRSPGKTPHTSPRKEEDRVEILSGVFERKTTGAPISILISNKDVDSKSYEPLKNLLRPGHANFTYLEKYGLFDDRGGGRASARETACRVAAGAIAKKFLQKNKIEIIAFLQQMERIEAKIEKSSIAHLRALTYQSSLFCPDKEAEKKMLFLLKKTQNERDSLGAIVAFIAEGLPSGLGDPVYEKLDANLARALMSLPAAKGFEIGSGFFSALMKGSEHNDLFVKRKERTETLTNHAGGVLGGISTGMPLFGRVAFKPTSSIRKPQKTLNLKGKSKMLLLPEGARHDPCVGIRAVPIVEAMIALVLADAILIDRCARL